MSLFLWTAVIAVLTAIACSLVGVLLVANRESFVAEGLSHAVLPGIIVAFLVFRDRSSPWLVIAAGLSGLVMVWLVKWIVRSGKVKQDAALGIVFSGMFSVGVIASSLNLKNIHFHAHCIIDGNLAFAPLDDCYLFGRYLGPQAFVTMLACITVIIGFVTIFFKELKLMVFDRTSSKLLGFQPTALHTVYLALVSIVAVAAFETAGTVLVVALMIAPPAAANLLTRHLSIMFFASAVLGAAAAALGVSVGYALDIAPAGPIASISGIFFLLAVFLAPSKGLFSRWRRQATQKKHLLQRLNRGLPASDVEGQPIAID